MNYCQFRNDFIKRMCNSIKPLLPPEFQQVEWIKNNTTVWMGGNATQWFSTGISPTNHYAHIEFEGLYNSRTMFGIVNTISGYSFGYYQGKYIIATANGEQQISGTVPDGRTNLDYNYNGAVYINGTKLADGTYSSSNALWVGGRKSTMSYDGKFYVFQITDLSTNTLVRDFIPCYRKSDNQPGMFDICGQSFYTNTNMTFTVGNNV